LSDSFVIIEILAAISLTLLSPSLGVFVFGKKIIDVKMLRANYKLKSFTSGEKSVVYFKDFFGAS